MSTYYGELRSWLSLLLLLPPAVWYLIRLFVYFKRRRTKSTIGQRQVTATSAVLKIEQQEPSRRPPAILNIVLLICSLFLLGLGVFGIYLLVAGKVTARVDISTIFFFILFIVLPMLFLADLFIIEPRVYKLGRSLVAKEAVLILGVDAGTAFDMSRAALDAMKANIIRMNKPRLLKASSGTASSGKCMITVEVRGIKGSKSRVYILSDSQWLTVKWDAGANQRCLDTFVAELRKQLG